ncbi:MAG: AAA family ATPase [Actinomycetota bacterium]|nr:AAA family ATPase [Actinomycetota bacterium]
MKIVVAGKGGVGKTTIAGTLARLLARRGHSVLALDADSNPMLGISLGIGPEETDALVAVRQGLETGETEHARSTEGFVGRFGRDAPDAVRLVVASRIERPDPGCPCCGVSPERLLGELEGAGRIVIGDLEAGVGTLLRLRDGQADLVLLVVQPSAKSIEVARRAIEIVGSRLPLLVVANRVRDGSDFDMVQAVADGHEVVVVPEDSEIERADQDGQAPIDTAARSPGVRAIEELAALLARGYALPSTASPLAPMAPGPAPTPRVRQGLGPARLH